ncbi:MAG: exodeoxyribonuclease VII small subunit [Legionellales bacterium]|nr:exodeoxyribonuclease VII small subunit [Legionellales bacterium]
MTKLGKKSFKSNYNTLKSISEVLRKQDDLDVDKMVEMVKSASEAYANCKQRLDDVQKAIEEYLPESKISEERSED